MKKCLDYLILGVGGGIIIYGQWRTQEQYINVIGVILLLYSLYQIYDTNKKSNQTDERIKRLEDSAEQVKKLLLETKYNGSLQGLNEIENLKQILESNKTLSDYQRGTICLLIGNQYQTKGDWHNAIVIYNEVFRLADLIKGRKEKETLLMYANYNLGILESSRSSYEKSLPYFNIAEKISISENIFDILPHIWYGQAQAMRNIGNTSSALLVIGKARDEFRYRNDTYWEAYSVNGIALVFRDMGKWEEASEYAIASNEMAKKLNALDLMARNYQIIGGNYRFRAHKMRQEESLDKIEFNKWIRESEKAFRNSYELFKRINDQNGVAYSLANLGHLRSMSGNFSEAKRYIAQAESIFRDLNDLRGIANEKANLGNLMMAENRLDEAISYLKEALNIQERIVYADGIAYTSYNLGVAHYKSGDVSKAKEYFKMSADRYEQLESNQALEIREIIANIDKGDTYSFH